MALFLIGAGSILMVVGGIICLQSVYNKGYTEGHSSRSTKEAAE